MNIETYYKGIHSQIVDTHRMDLCKKLINLNKWKDTKEYQRITFVIPCRSNLPYLQQAVGSIEEHYGDEHDVVILDDASDDDSWDWITEYSEGRDNMITYRNEGPDRVGHTVLYDVGIQISKN